MALPLIGFDALRWNDLTGFPTLLSCGGPWSKPVEEGFLLRSVFVVGDQPVVANLLKPFQRPFERRVWLSGRRRYLLGTTVYRGSAPGELLIGEG